MRVNVYAEEMTNRIEVISKEIEGQEFTGLRIYLELPATVNGQQYQGPFMHRPGDDDSSAVTFWGKRDLREVLRLATAALDVHYAPRATRRDDPTVVGPDSFGGEDFQSEPTAEMMAYAAGASVTPARAAVQAIVRDLTDRRGLHQAWDGIDEDIRAEITTAWEQIVGKAIATPRT